MHYLSVENISKSYGELQIFSQISFSIHKDQKIAIVAKNGSGKTSILKIIYGIEKPDEGQVVIRNGLRLALLNQEPQLNEELSIEETILTSNIPIVKIISAYKKALQNVDDTENYQRAFDAMDTHNAWEFEIQYQQILSQLNLTNLSLKVKTLSGGQKKRLALAQTLLSKPDILILDEPTNHLDLEMIEWLEDYFVKMQQTLLMVTHDRYFLERVCNEIIELDQGKLFSCKGNYSYFIEKKEARLTQESKEAKKTKLLLKKELNWMRRQPKARTTKSKSRTDNFLELKTKTRSNNSTKTLQLEINMERLGNKVIEFHKVCKSFDKHIILKNFNYSFKNGERIGIIGNNGSGKSTFLNLLTKNILPDSGKIVIGETVKIGYYTQTGLTVKPNQRIIDVIKAYGDYLPLTKGNKISAKQLLNRFLFDDKKQYDFVEKLSGGEQKRLYLCTVLFQNPNVLILDEPTNDLDIVTLNILENFLMEFPGVLIVVSHDRFFMDKIVDHLFVFKGQGIIYDFPGNYSEYRTHQTNNTPTNTLQENPITPKSNSDNKAKKLSYNEQKEFKNLESKIKVLEKTKQRIENKFNSLSLTQEDITSLSKELKDIEEEIAEKEMRWLELAEKFEL